MEKKQRFQTFAILLIIFAAGFILRFQYVKDATFPLNDGGLFYKMTQDLIENGFKLPEYTTYNQNMIPFAYPPLGFYITGLLSKLFHIPLLQLFLWFPFIINLAAIPIIFLLVKELTGNREIALFANGFWALALPSYEWLIMGGGVTRSLAFTLSILSLWLFTKYLRTGKLCPMILASALGGLVGLSHLEIFWVNVISIVIIWLYKTKKSFIKDVLYFLAYFFISIVIMLPYLLTVINFHGISPFLAGFQSGEFSIIPQLVKIILFNYTDEFSFTIIAVFALLGIFLQIKNRQYFFVVWFFVILILDPRSANRSISLPLCILAAITLNDLLIPAMKKVAPASNGIRLEDDQEKKQLFSIFRNIQFNTFFIVVVFCQIFILAFLSFYTNKSSMEIISTAKMMDFAWVKENTSPSSTFLILSGANDWQIDQLAEWFPAMTDRKSLTTVQGTEWFSDGQYYINRKYYDSIKKCLSFDVNCILETLDNTESKPDFIWIAKNDCNNTNFFYMKPLIELVRKDSKFTNIYESEQTIIFSVQ